MLDPGRGASYSKNRLVYGLAALVTMAIFLPLQHHAWVLYLGVCVGYTVLVFGLRRIELRNKPAPHGLEFDSGVLLAHGTFLAIVIGWVWLGQTLKPYLPYILTTEDTSHPYYGLAFLGIVGLFFLEAVEQRYLRAKDESVPSVPYGNSSDMGGNR